MFRYAVLLLLTCSPALAAETIVNVRDDASLQAALRAAAPGMRIRIAPGNYRPGVYVADRRGTEQQRIVIEGADPQRPPLFEGGTQGWHLSKCSYVTLRNIAVRGQKANGINCDDGGTFDAPARHLVLEKIHVADIGPEGNFDGIKLSGLDDLVVRDCVVEGWGGQAVDMVGCHRGLIEGCTFRGKAGFSQHTGPQTKGGCSDIVIRRCHFDRAGQRAAQLGGSTSMGVFRPQGAKYEAKDITVEGCTFTGGMAAVSFVGVDGATFRYNTIYRPEKWVMRILQETTAEGFPPCRNVRFERNTIVYRRADVQVIANIGPHTQPETFTFAHNLWFCEDRPAASRPQLPAAETDGVYDVDPQLKNPTQGDFAPQNLRAKQFGALALPVSR